MKVSAPSQPLPALPPAAGIPPPPVFGSQTGPGQKPGTKNPTPSFLGANATPSAAQRGQKALVGQ